MAVAAIERADTPSRIEDIMAKARKKVNDGDMDAACIEVLAIKAQERSDAIKKEAK